MLATVEVEVEGARETAQLARAGVGLCPAIAISGTDGPNV